MARDPNIPLFLWVAAAIVAHLTWGGGAEQVAEVFEERADVRRFAASVQQQLRRRFTSEIALLEEPSTELAQREPDDQPRAVDGPPDEDTSKKVDPPKIQPPDKPDPDPVPAADRVKKEKVKPEPEKAKPKDKVEPKSEPEKEPEKTPEVPPEKNQSPQRVAVVQHVENKNQADNPEAEFLGDDNNRVQEQTQARVTATDQDNEKPSPGSQHNGPTEEPGDSHVTDVAQSDDPARSIVHRARTSWPLRKRVSP
jgi:hypothetical protein